MKTIYHWWVVFVSLTITCLIANAQSDSSAEQAQSNHSVLPALLASQSLLLDIDRFSDGRLLVVGERGHILVSDDQGDNWRQILAVPTRTTLTSVSVSGQTAWAVGHDSTIISSSDSGENWSLQNQEEGGDTLLDVSFADNGQGFAIGAYGLLMHSEDKGQNWSQEIMADIVVRDPVDTSLAGDDGSEVDDGGFLDQDEIADFEDLDVEYHLNAFLRLDDSRIVIAAEAGRGYYSVDNGKSWRLYRLPYDGSMFGVVRAGRTDCLVTFGLRGNIFQTCDLSLDWQPASNSGNASIFDGVYDNDGDLWLVGSNGTLLHKPRQGGLAALDIETGDDLNGLLFVAERLLLIGESGVRSITLEALSSAGQR